MSQIICEMDLWLEEMAESRSKVPESLEISWAILYKIL